MGHYQLEISTTQIFLQGTAYHTYEGTGEAVVIECYK